MSIKKEWWVIVLHFRLKKFLRQHEFLQFRKKKKNQARMGMYGVRVFKIGGTGKATFFFEERCWGVRSPNTRRTWKNPRSGAKLIQTLLFSNCFFITTKSPTPISFITEVARMLNLSPLRFFPEFSSNFPPSSSEKNYKKHFIKNPN